MPAQYPVRLYSGGIIVSAGITMDGKTLKSGSCDSLIVSEGGYATNFVISAGGIANVSGGLTSNFQLYGKDGGGETSRGELRVFSGGTVQDTTINAYGALSVLMGGVASQITFTEMGELRTFGENTEALTDLLHVGTAAATLERVEQGAMQGSVSGLMLAGFATLGSEGVMHDCVITNLGDLEVSGGTIQATTIYGSATIYGGLLQSGLIASGAMVTAGSGTIVSSMTLTGDTANWEYGTLVLQSGASSYDLTVKNGGFVSAANATVTNLTVESGGTAKLLAGTVFSGYMQIENGGRVSAATSTTIDFSVNLQSAGGAALIDSWSRIISRSKATYTLTLDDDQADGTYLLAGSAGAFAKSITVKTADRPSIVSLTVGANALLAGAWFHTLTCNDGTLTYSCSSALIRNAAATVSATGTDFTWDAVTGAPQYQVTLDGGASWNDCQETHYFHEGNDTTYFQVRVSDGTRFADATQEMVTAGDATAVDVSQMIGSAGENAAIELRDGEYSGTGAVVMKDGQTLAGQGQDSTTVTAAIYGAGNAVEVKSLQATSNVVGGAANAAADVTDLTVTDTLLKDAFAGSLVNADDVTNTTAEATIAGTQFRNLYGAGYVTDSHTLTTTNAVLNVTGGSSQKEAGAGSLYGAGRAANGGTLAVDNVSVTVDNGIEASLGALYAGGYANGASTLTIGMAATTITTGNFTKFVAGGSQVYGSGTTGTAATTSLTVNGGVFGNAVLGASYAASSATATVSAATTTISGGTFNGYVAGGGYANGGTITVGSVNLTISGGLFTKYVFGGNIANSTGSTAVTGQVRLTLDASAKTINAQAIYAGSFNAGAVGSTITELKGDGANLSFKRLSGDGSYTAPATSGGVTGTRELRFTGFSGELTGKLYDFDTFMMTNSQVAFMQAQDLTGISTWALNLSDGVTAETALIDWSNDGANDFSNDVLSLNFDTAATTDLLVIKGGDNLDLALDKSGLTVNFNGSAASYANGIWSLDGWQLSNVKTDETNDLVLSRIA